ncbi:hypothetical protein LguiA_034846 [Lonicera macranthoides]
MLGIKPFDFQKSCFNRMEKEFDRSCWVLNTKERHFQKSCFDHCPYFAKDENKG